MRERIILHKARWTTQDKTLAVMLLLIAVLLPVAVIGSCRTDEADRRHRAECAAKGGTWLTLGHQRVCLNVKPIELSP